MSTEPILFARIIAHDLQSPIVSASEALRLSEEASPDQALVLRRIAIDSLIRAHSMVQGLRNFVRIEGHPAVRQRIDVNDLVADLIEEFQSDTRKPFAEIRVIPDLGNVFTSQVGLSHTFRNLISNAVSHNVDTDGLVIEIGRKDGVEATFYVSDNGKGIEPSEHEKVFQPFRQSSQRSSDGLGLGLALVRELVSQVGGAVTLDSKLGGGATFSFTWPSEEIAE